MNLKKLGAEHTIDVDLIPDRDAWILDVGCRGFEFDKELLALRPAANILAFDPDPSITDPLIPGILFFCGAVTEKVQGSVVWQGEGDGSYICGERGDPGYGWGIADHNKSAIAANATVRAIMHLHGISHFDLVKLDCEGSEFGILENWPGPIATQISVEFHDFIDRNRWNDAYFQKLFAGPLKDYRVALFGLTPLGPGNSMGHWDTLLVLK